LQIIAARHHDPQANYQLDLLTLVHLACKLADGLGFWVVKPFQPRTVEQILADLPPLLKSRIHIDEGRWRELLDRRVNCYADPDVPPPEREPREDPDLHVEPLAELDLPDLNEQKPPVPGVLKLVAIGVLLASIIVAVLYFAGCAITG
jgi:hypothetical protein